ncbi:MAG: tRNA (adenosine(37)-N6)-threonylcarbamoyltransferase complex ATPase subunit type 1 TsaE [Nocardiopsaceae bacterium]|nr:tRNA (adenosine(37)-N6)-threonylcarbamoyltransferase complex ATPase subunit type 1 TsaE [Nocardiopsaceae bacterium]
MIIPNGPSRLPFAISIGTSEEMRGFGRRLASVLRAGDLVILSGPLGAGKTTLTQGIADGLGVRGPVTSPTFVIARVHPPLRPGSRPGPAGRGNTDAGAGAAGLGGAAPSLVHADAYRLGSALELDDLDLDADLDTSVTVVEWGEGRAEGLSEDRLEIVIAPAPPASLETASSDTEGAADGDAPRTVQVSGVGSRWQDIQLPPANVVHRL